MRQRGVGTGIRRIGGERRGSGRGEDEEVSRRISFCVSEVALIVVVCLFTHGYGKNEREGADVGEDVTYKSAKLSDRRW